MVENNYKNDERTVYFVKKEPDLLAIFAIKKINEAHICQKWVVFSMKNNMFFCLVIANVTSYVVLS